MDDWDIAVGEELLRSELHDRWGGGRYGGMEPSVKAESVFLFSNPAVGKTFGYNYDGWHADGTFHYTGDGQEGDQSISKGGNKSLMDAASQGRTVRLFRSEGVNTTYLGAFTLADPPYYRADAPDRNGELRSVLVFRLLPRGDVVHEVVDVASPDVDRPEELPLEAGDVDAYVAGEPPGLGPELDDPEWREAHGLPRPESAPADFVVELNARHRRTVHGAELQFFQLFDRVVGAGARQRPVFLSTGYLSVQLSIVEMRRLLGLEADVPVTEQAVAAVWPDFPLRPLIDASTVTVKAPSSRLAFDATGRGITWGVVDSGIDARHPHFGTYNTLGESAASLHRDFSQASGAASVGTALEDPYGHGTHVAGILAGGLGCTSEVVPRVGERLSLRTKVRGPLGSTDYSAVEQHADDIDTFRSHEQVVERHVQDPSSLTGVAPLAHLMSLKVLDGNGDGRSSNAIRALRYVREEVNAAGLVVHGLNLSLGYEVNTRAFAAGQSPLCVEIDRLVRSGVVVVAAAGNTGFGEVSAQSRFTNAPLLATINDPGNAERAITVGATHRSDPHAHGISYFSSKGPTGDGRLKPDLVAPGERITSCATGTFLAPVLRALAASADDEGVAYYVDEDGTSMAAPHVSGAVAAFLSDRPEFIGRPEVVKDIFLRSATSLGRDRYFEGHGVVDVLRALQSV